MCGSSRPYSPSRASSSHAAATRSTASSSSNRHASAASRSTAASAGCSTTSARSATCRTSVRYARLAAARASSRRVEGGSRAAAPIVRLFVVGHRFLVSGSRCMPDRPMLRVRTMERSQIPIGSGTERLERLRPRARGTARCGPAARARSVWFTALPFTITLNAYGPAYPDRAELVLSVPVFARTTPRAGPVFMRPESVPSRPAIASDWRSGPRDRRRARRRGEQPGEQARWSCDRCPRGPEPSTMREPVSDTPRSRSAWRARLAPFGRRAATVGARADGLEQHLGGEVVGFLAHRPQHRVDARRRVEGDRRGARRRPAGADGAVDLHAGLPQRAQQCGRRAGGRATGPVAGQRQRRQGWALLAEESPTSSRARRAARPRASRRRRCRP